MKDLSIYFQPVIAEREYPAESIGSLIHVHDAGGFPEIGKGGLALIYVPEFRNGQPELHQQTDDRFREAFYRYYPGTYWKTELYDLGTLLPGERVEDTYFAVRQVVAELVKNKIIPIV